MVHSLSFELRDSDDVRLLGCIYMVFFQTHCKHFCWGKTLFIVPPWLYIPLSFVDIKLVLYREKCGNKTCSMAFSSSFPFFSLNWAWRSQESLWNVFQSIFHRHGLWCCWLPQAFPATDCRHLISLQERHINAKEFLDRKANSKNFLTEIVSWVENESKSVPIIYTGIVRCWLIQKTWKKDLRALSNCL